MEIFIRPNTLFNSEKFWGYANEPLPKKHVPTDNVGASEDRWSEFSKEERTFIGYLRIEYNKLLNKTLKLAGVERFEELPDNFMTEEAWIKAQLYERRKRLAKEELANSDDRDGAPEEDGEEGLRDESDPERDREDDDQ
ncbi:MAG: conserved phage C-terminal domain-containing protein [Rhodopseudomonas palustris]|nr:conserved phage C-terminal domain-containing protein [Rhodopseudomonas palustris]